MFDISFYSHLISQFASELTGPEVEVSVDELECTRAPLNHKQIAPKNVNNISKAHCSHFFLFEYYFGGETSIGKTSGRTRGRIVCES